MPAVCGTPSNSSGPASRRCAIVHNELRDSAGAIARISGHPDYPMITVDYPYIPTATWSADEIQSLAKELAPQIRDLLLGRTQA